jgi:hypothetical protein
MGKKNNKKNKKLVIKFDENDRKNFLLNQGKKYSKKERKNYQLKLKQEKKRKAKKESNRLMKEEIEKKYEELHAMQKEMNRYANLSDEEEENED